METKGHKREPIPPTKVSVAEDGSVIGIQEYMDWNGHIVGGMGIQNLRNADEEDHRWVVFAEDPEHGGGLSGRGTTLKEALDDSGLHPSLHRCYERVFELTHVTRSAVAKILGRRAANYEIVS